MNNTMTIAAIETANDLRSIEVSTLKDVLACYKEIAELRKAVTMLTQIQPRLGKAAQLINAGRIKRAKADLDYFLGCV